ncbi:MAG: cyclopropane-fatty-acyl-phospholipid synthase family protein [Ottowia sp.]|nr:cyclopropane-fatty-acyl-phospholipid synthase family protein [Ottowia sp.]
MSVATSSPIKASIDQLVERLRNQIELPVLVRWKGNDGVKLGRFDTPSVIVDVQNAKGAAALAAPSLDSLGTAYVEGNLDVQGSVQDILATAYQLSQVDDSGLVKPGLIGRVTKKVIDSAAHSKGQDKADIQYHYDVSNAFYAEWLDPAMLYSCAYFENGDETLAQAQTKKLDHILTKARLQPGQRLLDIGCGWGALVLRAAQKFGARCVGITLSQNQYDLATERVREAGLQDQVEIRLQDYRDVTDTFDRVTSIGMCEHVGLANLEQYFRIIRDRLAPDGWVLNHNITTCAPDHEGATHGGGDFIDRYVFPDGELPHISKILHAMQRSGLEPIDAESLRRHYAQTLRCWSDTFEAKSEKLRTMVADKTWRIWRMYLVGCQWAFENDEVSVFQVLAHRAGQHSDTLPRSRRWMYA